MSDTPEFSQNPIDSPVEVPVNPNQGRAWFKDEADGEQKYSDTLEVGPFKIFVIEIPDKIKKWDGQFAARAIDELQLLPLAIRKIGDVTYESDEKREEAIYDEAMEMVSTEEFRADPRPITFRDQKMTRSEALDVLLEERYDTVICACVTNWKAQSGGKPQRPFSKANLVGLRTEAKLMIYERLASLTRYGAGDQLFRRANRKGSR